MLKSFYISVHVPINFFFMDRRDNPEIELNPVLEIKFKSSSLNVLKKLLKTASF